MDKVTFFVVWSLSGLSLSLLLGCLRVLVRFFSVCICWIRCLCMLNLAGVGLVFDAMLRFRRCSSL